MLVNSGDQRNLKAIGSDEFRYWFNSKNEGTVTSFGESRAGATVGTDHRFHFAGAPVVMQANKNSKSLSNGVKARPLSRA